MLKKIAKKKKKMPRSSTKKEKNTMYSVLTSPHWWNILLACSCIDIDLLVAKGWVWINEVPRLGREPPEGKFIFNQDGHWP